MKNEPFFAVTAAIVLAGVIASFASPASTPVVQPLAPAKSISVVVATPMAPVAVVAPADANPVTAPAIHSRHGRRHAVEKS